MMLKRFVLKMTPEVLKKKIKELLEPDFLLKDMASNIMSKVYCVDVGASYFPHTKWGVFLKSKNTSWVAVDPNEQNLGYTKQWNYASSCQTITKGLSSISGFRDLYVTNVDSGSSLFEPIVNDSVKHRYKDLSYFFPVKKIKIETSTLDELFLSKVKLPMCVKIDAQGAELDILNGAAGLLSSRSIIGIESEATLQACPVMNGSGKFSDLCQFLEGHGFELLEVITIPFSPKYGKRSKKSSIKLALNECDAVFALRVDKALELEVEYRVALLGFYITNGFYEEALSLLEMDHVTFEYVIRQEQGKKLVETLEKVVQ